MADTFIIWASRGDILQLLFVEVAGATSLAVLARSFKKDYTKKKYIV